MKATLSNYRQSPRKVRLVADLIRGKRVPEAIALLRFAEQRAAESVLKVLRSAIANAQQQGKEANALVVDAITVNQGITYRRFMPRARGAASPINRRSSHISIMLTERAAKGTTQKAKPANVEQPQNAS